MRYFWALRETILLTKSFDTFVKVCTLSIKIWDLKRDWLHPHFTDLAPLIPDQLFLSFNRNGIGVVGLDLTESLDCTFDYENPKQITLDSQNWWHNYGGVMSGDKVVACGDQSCYSLTQEAGLDFVASLSMSREFAAAITINDDTLFVAGGRIEGRSVTISDFIRPGQVPASVPGPELPYPVDGHCFVKINETTAYLFGGLDETDFETNKTAFYDIANNRFIEGEPRNIKQYDAACQLLVIDGVSYVVAIGGEGEEKGKCWVWNSITESWKNEEPIFDYDPVDAGIIKANGVDNGFFIFGGYTDLQEDTLPAIYFVTYDPISGFTSQLLEQRLPWDFSTYVELPDSWKKDVTCIETTYQGE